MKQADEPLVAFSPKTAEAVEAWRESERAYGRNKTQRAKNSKLACAIYSELTGNDLPWVHYFEDPQTHERYRLEVWAELRPVPTAISQEKPHD